MRKEEIISLFSEHTLTNLCPIHKSGKRQVYEAIYDGRRVVIKIAEDSKRARREFCNQKKAYELLYKKKGLKVAEVIAVRSCCIVSEYIDGKPRKILSHRELQEALRYIHVLHSFDYRSISCLKNHYYGEKLVRRLKDENGFFTNAINKDRRFLALKNSFNKILKLALRYALHDEPVVGHGDFQAKNIIVTETGIAPIDWIDFGILLRWYEVGNLLFGQKKDELLGLIEYYLSLKSEQPITSLEELAKESLSIAFVVRTGSHFRHVVETDEDPSKHFCEAERNLNYINRIFGHQKESLFS